MKSYIAEKLSRKYNVAVIAAAVFLVILLLAGLWQDFSSGEKGVVFDTEEEIKQRARHVSRRLEYLSERLARLRKKTEELLSSDYDDNVNGYLETVESTEGIFKFNSSEAGLLEHRGSLLGVGNPEDQGAEAWKLIHSAVMISSEQKSICDLVGEIEWMFYVTGSGSDPGFVSFYPPCSADRGLIRDPVCAKDFLSSVYEEEFWQDLGKGDEHPGGVTWRELLYGKKNGKDTRVVCSAPIYDANRFAGATGLVVYANNLQACFDPLDHSDGQLVMARKSGSIVNMSPSFDVSVKGKVARLFGSGAIDGKKGHVKMDGGYVFFSDMDTGLWKMIYIVGEGSLFGDFRAAFAWKLIIVAVFIAIIVTSCVLLRFLVISPAVGIIDHVKVVSSGKKSPITRIPEAWKPWFESVTEMCLFKPLANRLNGTGVTEEKCNPNDRRIHVPTPTQNDAAVFLPATVRR